jgi:hypothetical protein
MGEPQDPVAGELEGSVACTVSLERGAGTVERVAVDLDYQPLAGPVGVDLEALDELVDVRRRHVMLPAKVEEQPLELRAGGGRRAAQVGDNPDQCPEAPPAAPTHADVLDRTEVEQVSALGLLDCAGELMLRNDPCQVEERPRNRGDGDSRTPGAITVAQLFGHVYGDAGAIPAARCGNRYVDARRRGRLKPPERRGASVREHRARAGGQDRSNSASVRREHTMANGVDAMVDAVQATAGAPTVDSPPR